MKKPFSVALLCLIQIGSFFPTEKAQAMVGSKLDISSISEAEEEQVKDFINTEVRADMTANFDDRITEFSKKTEFQPPMDARTRAVLLKGAFVSAQSLSTVPLNEEKFNEKVGSALDWMRTHGLLPHAITIGALARRTWGADFTAGFNFGAESNLYVQGGKIMMTNYSLKGGQVGAGTPVCDEEFYIAFCFGACFGGDPNGYYMGVDADLTAGAGAGFFMELGIDVSTLYKTIKSKNGLSIADAYDSSTFYLGFSIDVGVGGEAALGVYRYKQIGIDRVLANPGQNLDPRGIVSQVRALMP